MIHWQMSSEQCEVGLNESYSPTAAGSVINWHAVWASVAADLNSDTFAPKFLTEDGIRRTTLRALNSQLDVLRHVEIEYPSVNLSGDKLGRLDLVVSPVANATVIEFKYPREPRQKLPPWPDHLGGVLSDTYRLGMLAAGPKGALLHPGARLSQRIPRLRQTYYDAMRTSDLHSWRTDPARDSAYP